MLAVSPNRDALLQIANQIPGSCQVLGQLAELLTDVNSGLDDIAQLLRRDTGLAARIIRISNSVMFGAGARIATIEDAVNRVGYAEIYRLTGLATAAQLADHHLSYYGITGVQLRDNTLITSLACEALASRADIDPRVAYTVGLLRSTGKIVLDRYAKKHQPASRPFFSSGTPEIEVWEQNTFGICNPEVAQTILTVWRFPNTITEPLRHQYSTTLSPTGHGKVAMLLHVARALAAQQNVGLIGENDQEGLSEPILRTLDITAAAAKECGEEAAANYQALKALL